MVDVKKNNGGVCLLSYRNLSPRELKKHLKDNVPLSVVLSNYIISKDVEFLVFLPRAVALFLLDNSSPFDTDCFQRFKSVADIDLFNCGLKELLRSKETDPQVKLDSLKAVLYYQHDMNFFIGFLYDCDFDFIISNINSPVQDDELIELLVNRAGSIEEKRKLLFNEFVYFNPAELLNITNDEPLIIEYILSLNKVIDEVHLEVFADIVESLRPDLLFMFNLKHKEIRSRANIYHLCS